MKVSQVEEIEEEFIGERRIMPFTMFSLEPSEIIKYNSFRSERDNLESTLKNIPSKEKEERMGKVSNLFSEFIMPYLENYGLECSKSHVYWGNSKRVCVNTPHYNLFKKGESFDVCAEAVYWFSTRDENLRGTSYLSLVRTGPLEKQVIYNLIKRTIQDESGDGIKYPLFDFRGDFMYFASTNFSKFLMLFIREMLEEIGPKTMEELSVLYRESLDRSSNLF